MQRNLFGRLCSLVILIFLFGMNTWAQEKSVTVENRREGGASSQQKKAPPQKPLTEAELREIAATKTKPPSGASFYMAPIIEQPGNFTVLVTDEEGRSASDQISTRELPVLEAILETAKKFAASNEAVGQTRAQTTRFSDQQLPRYFVDVSKVGNQSRFQLRLDGLMGKVTLNAGAIKRTDREATSMLYDILDIVKKALAGEQTPQTTIKFKIDTQQQNRPPQ